MDAHERFEEISVRELAGPLRLVFEPPERWSKGPLDLRFVGLLDPDEDEIYVARFERLRAACTTGPSSPSQCADALGRTL